MSFVTALALAIAAFVVVPFLAHRLRRRRAEERSFAAARLVPPAPPKARRRAKLEDRALFSVRALAVVALAVLGASPLVRCSRLSLERAGGASVAVVLVVDDSLSMRAVSKGTSRFERACKGARELVRSAREGDAIALVLAGAPARVALAPTTDLGAAHAAVDSLTESDRATDLDGALVLAHSLVASLPQLDRRVVLLSDGADGTGNSTPLGEGDGVWNALPELSGPLGDCAVLAADRSGLRVRVSIACSEVEAARGRAIVLMQANGTVAVRADLPVALKSEVVLSLPKDEPVDLFAELTGHDTIEADNRALVLIEAGQSSLAVVADMADQAAATGGAPVVEQALAALRLDVWVRPIPALPDRVDELRAFAGVLVDDPPGFTPEERRALASMLEEGGVALLALGPRAASAPLGASFEPVLREAVRWAPTTASGAASATALGALVEGAKSLENLGAKARIELGADDVAGMELLLRWQDGAPLVARRAVGRGEVWVVTLPFAVGASDLTLRPGFLALLDAFVDEARTRASPRRSDVGSSWTFAGAHRVEVQGPLHPREPPGAAETAGVRYVPARIGPYAIEVDGKRELRVAAPVARELDPRARPLASPAQVGQGGDRHASVDASPVVAVVLLGLLFLELVLRALGDRLQEQPS